MLILARNKDERIILRDRDTDRVLAVITVISKPSEKTRLGFAAGPEVIVDREEIDLIKHPRSTTS